MKENKSWVIKTPTQELFDEVIAHDIDAANPLQANHWKWYQETTYVTLEKDSKMFKYGSTFSSSKYKPEGKEITIEEFREMYGKKEEAVEQTKPTYDQYAQVGDITSDKKGSGARYNNGKPDYSMVLIGDIIPLFSEYPTISPHLDTIVSVLVKLGVFQKTHDVTYLYHALECLGLSAVEESTHVFTYGANKYKAWNWTKGANWSIPLACAVRHSLAVLNGEEKDVESGRKHEGHIVCNILMLIHYTQYYKEGNDLPPKELFESE